MGSIHNIVRVALTQIGVIVAGILGAGLSHKISLITGRPMPFLSQILYSYGIFGFIIPIVWGTTTLIVRHRNEISDITKELLFWLGVLLLIALAVFVVVVDVRGLMP